MRKGLALILVVGVLGVLSVLGSGFVVLSRLERRAAQQRLMSTKATLLARSGIEDAQARLDAGQVPEYGGEDWNGDKLLNAGPETDGQILQPGVLNRADCPVRQALRPSFFRVVGGNPNPKLVAVQGRMRGYSGMLGSEDATWSIKVVPDGGGFDVNGGDPSVQSDPALTSDLNTTLRRMFAVLAEAIDREDGAADGVPVSQADGMKLITLRPGEGWASFEQIRDTALGGSQAKLDAFRDYLQLGPWTDLKVVAGNAEPSINPMKNYNYYANARAWRTGRWFDPANGGWWMYDPGWQPHTRFSPDLEASPRSFWSQNGWSQPDALPGRVVGRAPVDLAWARSRRPALIALLGNLRSAYFHATQFSIPGTSPISAWETLGIQRVVRIALDWAQPTDDCRTVADLLMGTTSDLSTWPQFNDFCDALPLTGISDLGQAKKDLLKANFNPNTDTNKFNPEASLWKIVDKSDLMESSLELNLVPRNAWRITSVGRILSSASRSERVLHAGTRPDLLFKLTSQGELLAEDLGHPGILGDESGFRGPADPRAASASQGTNKTFGHKLLLAPPSGVTLQTYPEPLPVCQAGLPAFYDGQLKLATVEVADDQYAGAGFMRFKASFDDDFVADFSLGSPALDLNPQPLYHPDGRNGLALPSAPLWPSSATDRWAPPWPGSLYPNGAFQDGYMVTGHAECEGSCLGYASTGGNLERGRPTLSFWFKPMGSIPAVRPPGMTNPFSPVAPPECMGDAAKPPPAAPLFDVLCSWAAFIPSASYIPTGPWLHRNKTSSSNGQSAAISPRPWDSRWYLGTFSDDIETPRLAGQMTQDDPSMQISVDRGWLGGVKPLDHNHLLNECFFVGEGIPGGWAGTSTGRFYLGSYGGTPGPCTTIDEYLIYDYGADTAAGETLALERFTAGRYYKESDYPQSGGLGAPLALRTAAEWFSAPVDLGPVRLRSLSWTQIVPRGLRSPGPGAGQRPEDGDPGPDARIVMELAHKDVQMPPAAGVDYAVDASGAKIRTLFQDPRGERLGRRVDAPFRLHAVFQPRLSDPDNTAILDPLTLDDVTVSYRPITQSALSQFGEGEG